MKSNDPYSTAVLARLKLERQKRFRTTWVKKTPENIRVQNSKFLRLPNQNQNQNQNQIPKSS
jgi:hypothetical protein